MKDYEVSSRARRARRLGARPLAALTLTTLVAAACTVPPGDDAASVAPANSSAANVAFDRDPDLGTPRDARPADGADAIPLKVAPLTKDARGLVRAYFESYESEYGLADPAAELEIVGQVDDEGDYAHLATSHIRVRQSLGSLPIFGAEAIVHVRDGVKVSSVNGRLISTPSLDVSPTLSPDEARRRAAATVDGSAAGASRGTANPDAAATLGVFVPALFSRVAGSPTLAYRVEDRGFITYVDAKTGAVPLTYDDLKTAQNRETFDANNTANKPGTLAFAEADGASCFFGYDLRSAADQALVLDYDGDGKKDIFFYRPGRGAAWLARSNGNGSFTTVYAVGDDGSAAPNGIAGYDLLSTADQVLVFDYNGDKKDDLFLYRPGRGAAWVARSNGDGSFTAVYAVGDNGPAAPNGIAGFDLLSPADRALAFDHDGDGKQDLFIYRPGRGAAWVARSNGDGSFSAPYAVGDDGPQGANGVAGYDLLSPNDRVLVFDHDGDKRDDLFLYRPGTGAAWVARSRGDGTFDAAYATGDQGIAGYDLLSPADRALAFDHDGDGKKDLLLYRPGRGAAWVARSNGNGTFSAPYTVGDNGPAAPNGIAGFDLLSPSDRIVAFDYDGDRKDDLFMYRPGRGAAWVARSIGNGTFSAPYAVGDASVAPPSGIGDFDLLSSADSVLALDYDGDARSDLFLFRPGGGRAGLVHSASDGSFEAADLGKGRNLSDACNAHRFVGAAYRYYSNTHGRDSYDGHGARLTSVVDYNNPTFCPNARWNGVDMTYCEGFPQANDVVAHELTHAVIEKTAKLAYVDESGALNESYSDVFGAMVDRADWLIGEDLPGGAIRSLAYPAAYRQPDHEMNYVVNGDVHINSGIPNKAAFLASEGGRHHGVTVRGLGRSKVERIYYRTLTARLFASANFYDASLQTLVACRDLVGSFGITADDCTQISNAFIAVGMAPGVAGYDLTSAADQVVVFDYNGDGRKDLFLYRPGQGAAWVARSNGDGSFTAVYGVGDNGPASPNGIAGYDLLAPNDRVLAFDYNGDKKDDLFFYRPGRGAAWVARSNGDGSFTTVYAVGDDGPGGADGIAGYDFASPNDRALVLDYNGDGRKDLFFYRPGQGAAWVARSNGDGSFTAVYAVGDNGPAAPNGIAGYDLLSSNDQVLAFDYDGDKKDDLFLYRPGRGAAWVARSLGDGRFSAAYAVGDDGAAAPNGIAGFDLLSTNDRVVAFDHNGDGRKDLFLYRPGQGAAYVAQSNPDGTFAAAYAVGDNGSAPPNGIGGYDLLSTADQVIAFDHDGDRKEDLFLYRPGTGAAWVARSAGNGTFTAVYAVGDNGKALPNGIAGYDMLSPDDRALPLDFDGDGRIDLFTWRRGVGKTAVIRADGTGKFTRGG